MLGRELEAAHFERVGSGKRSAVTRWASRRRGREPGERGSSRTYAFPFVHGHHSTKAEMPGCVAAYKCASVAPTRNPTSRMSVTPRARSTPTAASMLSIHASTPIGLPRAAGRVAFAVVVEAQRPEAARGQIVGEVPERAVRDQAFETERVAEASRRGSTEPPGGAACRSNGRVRAPNHNASGSSDLCVRPVGGTVVVMARVACARRAANGRSRGRARRTARARCARCRSPTHAECAWPPPARGDLERDREVIEVAVARRDRGRLLFARHRREQLELQRALPLVRGEHRARAAEERIVRDRRRRPAARGRRIISCERSSQSSRNASALSGVPTCTYSC